MGIVETYAAEPVTVDADWDAVEAELVADLREQLDAVGLALVKILPNRYLFSAVVSNAENTKWINVTTGDVRTRVEWPRAVRLRRMSSERDWKGDEFHYAPWVEVGDACVEYLEDAYDDEVL